MKFPLLIAITLFLFGCPNYDPPSGSLEILNYSDSAIYVYCTCSDEFPGSEPPLSLFLITKHNRRDRCGQEMRDTVAPNYRINPYSWGNVYIGGTAGSPAIRCEKKRVSVYFIKEETMRNYSWKSICNKKLYEKKMSFSQSQLEEVCWRITYD